LADHVLFLAANIQRLHPVSTVLTPTMGARKSSIVFVTKQVICALRKKGSSSFVLAHASNKNKLTMLKEIKNMHNNS